MAQDTSGPSHTSYSPFVSNATTASEVRIAAPARTGDKNGIGSTEQASDDRPLPPSPAGYRLIRRLGHGGMGDVVLACESATERIVAMKFLRAPSSPGSFDRFLVEVKALARLDHPNIVRVLSPDFLRSEPYFTMEYAAGGALSERVKRSGPLPSAEAARVIAAVARAIHAAHGADVLHRDLKPSNILLMADGTPKVSDFGLAKRTDVEDDLTKTGPLGTPSFMPPEQISKKHGPIGPRSDVYALGASLYYLATGVPPFVGISSEEILQKVESEPPDRPRLHRPDLPLELEGIILKCLEKRPQARYESAAALAEDLDRFLAGQVPLAPPWTRWRRLQRWLSRHRRPVGISAGGVVPAIGLIALAWAFQRAPAPPPTEPETPPPPSVKIPGASEEVVQDIQQRLRQGEPASLVGPDGVPRWHRWRLGAGSLVQSKINEKGVAVWSRWDECLLELVPDPGIDRYRITAELCHEANVAPDSARVRLGLFFFAEDTATSPRAAVHSFGRVAFSDSRFAAGSPVEAAYRLVNKTPGGMQTFRELIGQSNLPEQLAELPGPWRKLEVLVAGDRLIASIDGHVFAAASRDDLQNQFASIQSEINKHHPEGGARLKGVPARAPLGIWVSGAQVGIRNVVITPVP